MLTNVDIATALPACGFLEEAVREALSDPLLRLILERQEELRRAYGKEIKDIALHAALISSALEAERRLLVSQGVPEEFASKFLNALTLSREERTTVPPELVNSRTAAEVARGIETLQTKLSHSVDVTQATADARQTSVDVTQATADAPRRRLQPRPTGSLLLRGSRLLNVITGASQGVLGLVVIGANHTTDALLLGVPFSALSSGLGDALIGMGVADLRNALRETL
jgi:hypothetical protein